VTKTVGCHNICVSFEVKACNSYTVAQILFGVLAETKTLLNYL